MDDVSLDYSYKNYTSNCSEDNILIKDGKNSKFIKYVEDSLDQPVRNIIIFSNQNTLKVNSIGLLSNNTLISFIDDASTFDTDTNKNSTHLK